jgi:predicted RNA binding protein YcfA (HicA-like mRNA interferase family)
MPRWVKRWTEMVENPKGWTYDEVATVLTGLEFVPPSKPKGSHRWWHHRTIGIRVGIPDYGHGEVAVEYVKKMIADVRSAGLDPNSST